MPTTSEIKELNASTFETELENAPGPVLLDFWAEWCGPCRQMLPVLQQLADEVDDSVTVAKVNIDESPELAQRFGIQSIPSFVVLENGQQVARHIGVTSKDHLKVLLS